MVHVDRCTPIPVASSELVSNGQASLKAFPRDAAPCACASPETEAAARMAVTRRLNCRRLSIFSAPPFKFVYCGSISMMVFLADQATFANFFDRRAQIGKIVLHDLHMDGIERQMNALRTQVAANVPASLAHLFSQGVGIQAFADASVGQHA